MNTVHIMTDDSSSEQNNTYIEQVALFTLSQEQQDNTACTILCTSSETIRRYNKDFRNKDYVTDVLSFCTGNTIGNTIGSNAGDNATTETEQLEGSAHMPNINLAQNQGALQETHMEALNGLPQASKETEQYIGDIVLCIFTVTQQAQELGVHFLEELTRTVIHGILHLLGYTHSSYDKEEPMLVKQELLLSKFITSTKIGTHL